MTKALIGYGLIILYTFVVWGPFASYALAKRVCRHAREAGNRLHTVMLAFIVQGVVFMPVGWGEHGFWMIIPWWVGILLDIALIDRWLNLPLGGLAFILSLSIIAARNSRG